MMQCQCRAAAGEAGQQQVVATTVAGRGHCDCRGAARDTLAPANRDSAASSNKRAERVKQHQTMLQLATRDLHGMN